jgi:hypothetical protein
LTEAQQARQKEYMDLRMKVQELREKVEPIKHTKRMERLLAEADKLTNFLDRNDEYKQPNNPGKVTHQSVTPHIKASDPSTHEKDCGCIACTFWTKP